jgi:hypothetical protein
VLHDEDRVLDDVRDRDDRDRGGGRQEQRHDGDRHEREPHAGDALDERADEHGTDDEGDLDRLDKSVPTEPRGGSAEPDGDLGEDAALLGGHVVVDAGDLAGCREQARRSTRLEMRASMSSMSSTTSSLAIASWARMIAGRGTCRT